MIRIGTSGWVYPRWRGTFYPKGLVQRRELEYKAQRLNSVEINGSFYALGSEDPGVVGMPEKLTDLIRHPPFHPNAAGMEATALAIADHLRQP